MSKIHVEQGERAHVTRAGVIVVPCGSLIDRMLLLRSRVTEVVRMMIFGHRR